MSDYINCAVTVNPKLIQLLLDEAKALNTNVVNLNKTLTSVLVKEHSLIGEISKLRAELPQLVAMSSNLAENCSTSTNSKVDEPATDSTDLISISDAFDEFIREHPDSDPKKLAVRAKNCLRRSGIHTIKDLTYLDVRRLRRIRNLGKQTLELVLAVAEHFGIQIPHRADESDYDVLKEGDLAVSLVSTPSIPAYSVVTVEDVYELSRYNLLPVYVCQLGKERATYSISQLRKL